MKKRFQSWTIGIIANLLVILLPVGFFVPRTSPAANDPSEYPPEHPVHADHKDIANGEF